MGCCFSSPTTQNQNPKNPIALKNQQPHEPLPPSSLPPPPPPPLEEESVKEVLSETPIFKPNQVPILMPETKTQMALVQNPPEKFETKGPIEEVSEAVSQLSETYSISESFSTATTTTATITVTEKREEDEATSIRSSNEGATSRKWDPSPAKKRPHAGEVGKERRVKSPARKPEPSPEKKVKVGSRVVRGRESGPVANRKRNAVPGEVSGRRSRSPSCGRTVGGTSKVGAGGGRKQTQPANEVENEKEKVKEKEKEAGEINDVVAQEECLENPHVSMECFIFL